MVVLQIMISVT